MAPTDLCDANKALGLEVRDFVLNVPDAKEESITDYLVWKWRALDARFNYINVKTFNRQEEHATTGADFELELWLVGQFKCLPLLFQAKKFTKPYAGYVRTLNYPNNTQAQLQKLLSYSASQHLLPFYSIYTCVAASLPLCGGRTDFETDIYMIDGATIKEIANGPRGRKVSLQDLLQFSNPFHCMFCCPMGIEGSYFQHYFLRGEHAKALRPLAEMPEYARRLLSRQPGSGDAPRETYRDAELPPVRAIGVYDLKDRV